MRVISGKYRRTNLKTLEGQNTRPTKDMVKEALFSSLGDLKAKSFLDLFAGSGAIGIEALSRGAAKVIMNDHNPEAYGIIQDNLNKVKAQAEVYDLDYQICLNQLKGEYFDYIYLDPPYAFNDHQKIFDFLKEEHLIDQDSLIICETHKDFQLNITEDYMEEKVRHYGITALYYYRLKEQNHD